MSRCRWDCPHGDCMKCRRRWCDVGMQYHQTLYTCTDEHPQTVGPCAGIFPLCEACWQSLRPEGRLPFYRKLFDRWRSEGAGRAGDWPVIQAAVLEGL